MTAAVENSPPARWAFAVRVLQAAGIVSLFVLLLLLLWYTVDALLLAFTGVLMAIVLRTPAEALARRTGMPVGAALGIVIVVLAAGLGAFGWLVGDTISKQASQFSERIPEIAAGVKTKLEGSQLGRLLLKQTQGMQMIPGGQEGMGRATGAISRTFGAIANVAIVLFLGIYLAANPKGYQRGLVRLVPLKRRKRTEQVLGEICDSLQNWLLARLISMAVVGTLFGLGLWALGVPFPLVLGIIAGLLEFVPYVGPILAALPAVMFASAQGPTSVLAVIGLYVAIQFLESFVLQPLIESRAVEIPPALVLFAQVAMGSLIGGLGVVLATPLACVAMVATQRLYIEDVLGEKAPEEQKSRRKRVGSAWTWLKAHAMPWRAKSSSATSS